VRALRDDMTRRMSEFMAALDLQYPNAMTRQSDVLRR
jgi:hypothetical protein